MLVKSYLAECYSNVMILSVTVCGRSTSVHVSVSDSAPNAGTGCQKRLSRNAILISPHYNPQQGQKAIRKNPMAAESLILRICSSQLCSTSVQQHVSFRVVKGYFEIHADVMISASLPYPSRSVHTSVQHGSLIPARNMPVSTHMQVS